MPSKDTPMNLLEIWMPKYKDRTVLLAKFKVKQHNKVVFTKAKHLAGKEFYISGEKAQEYPVITNGKVDCYAVDFNALEPII